MIGTRSSTQRNHYIQRDAINGENCADGPMNGSRREGIPSVEPPSEARTPRGEMRTPGKELVLSASGRVKQPPGLGW